MGMDQQTQGDEAMDQTNLDIYGHAPIPWSRAEQQLEKPADETTTYFLTTVRPDGRPHVAGVGALWIDGKFYFVSGPGTRKSRNLAERADCVISVKLTDLDLVVEGTATRVTDESTLERLAKAYDAQGWPATAKDGAITAPFSAPSAGPAPWFLYEFTPKTAFGVATAEPHGAMRWDL
jgi:general stress protein 26